MARLNEPPPPIESIESRKYKHTIPHCLCLQDTVKRRFIRQNRDIARANSTQSLRIRNLENETSRLLAENLVLREQILRLQSDLEADKAQQIVDNTRATKSQLEEKLAELSTLISGLGVEPARKKSPQVTKTVRESPSRSPAQKEWKNMYTMGEVVRGLEGSLPAILENKTYPRRTLECVDTFSIMVLDAILTYGRLQELEDIISDEAADTTNSPEIGPPPISQFVDQDPVKVDLVIRPRKVDHEETLDLDPAFSVNLEHRKKRKDSIGGQESRRASNVELMARERDVPNPLKTGAKRKLSVRDDDEREVSVKPIDGSPDDFQFRRVTSEEKSRTKAVPPPEKSSSRGAREFATVKGGSRENRPGSTTPANRKALAPKSTNDSPRKGSKAVVSDSTKSAKVDGSKPHHSKERSRERIQEPVLIKQPEAVILTSKIQTKPEAPTEPDIFSPPSLQPSTYPDPRDTSPPTDIAPRDEDPRPSRRSRGSISYAEPNLRAKMRRPTNEFVAAVATGSQQNHSDVVKLDDQSVSVVKVKTEPTPDNRWKERPVVTLVENSPLKGKAPATESLPSSITTHRKRRESMLNESEPEPRGPGSAIAALLAEKRRAKAEARAKELKSKDTASNLDIYEFRASSPEAMKVKEAKPAPRSRRHTAIVRDMAYVDEGDASDIESLRVRRQSTLSLRSSTASAESEKEDGEKTLRKATSSVTMADSAAAGTRGERIAARRRSMML